MPMPLPFLLLALGAADPQLVCDGLSVAEARRAMAARAEALYPESRDRVEGLLATAEAEQAAGRPVQACAALSQARNDLARVEGPRLLGRDRPDPLVGASAPCSGAEASEARLRATFAQQGELLYPRARKQIATLLDGAAALAEPQRCAVYREVRIYLVWLFPYLAKKLRDAPTPVAAPPVVVPAAPVRASRL
jgi:hypothetical protein